MVRHLRKLIIAITLPIATIATGQELVSSGSGFIINDAGWILTNRHVVQGCSEVRVAGIGTAETIRTDHISDLAVVFAGRPVADGTLTFRRSPARLAEPVIALGFPYSDLLTPSIRVTDGSVNALGGLDGDRRYVQVSTPIQPGNSGGPILDIEGRVVGIATSTLASGEDRPTQNVNFALDVQEALRFLDAQGLRYEAVDGDAQDTAHPVVEVVAAAVRSVVYLTCYDSRMPVDEGQVAAPIPPAAPTPVDDLVIRYGIDVLGHDYMTLRDTDLPRCSAACDSDPNCRALTFNDRHSICFLKEGASVLLNNRDAVAGIRRSALGGVLAPIVTVEANRDSPGSDLGWYDDIDFIGCVAVCAENPDCRAFAYIRRLDPCWLKSRLGTVVSAEGIELGWFNR